MAHRKIPEDSSLRSCYVFSPHGMTLDQTHRSPRTEPLDPTPWESEPFVEKNDHSSVSIATVLHHFTSVRRCPFALRNPTAAVLFLSAILGTAVAMGIFFAVARVEQSGGLLLLRGVCDQVKFRFDESFRDIIGHLFSTSALFASGTVPSNQTWVHWAEVSAQHPRSEYVLFAPRVWRSQRSQWEREHNAAITGDMSNPTNISSQAPWHYPVQYCAPTFSSVEIGDDTWRDPECGTKIRKAVTTGQPTAWAIPPSEGTFPFKSNKVTNRWLISYAIPIYYSNGTSTNRNQSLADGVVASGSKLELIVNSAVTYLADYPDVLVAITDGTPNPQIMYQNQADAVVGSGQSIEMEITGADESWRLVCRSRKPFPVTFASVLAGLIAAFWALMTLFIYRINLTTRYFEAARAEVSRNKDILFSTQLKLNSLTVNATAILRAIADPLVLVDHEGYIQYANVRASALFGYTDLCNEVPVYERECKRFLTDISDAALNLSRSASCFTNDASYNNSGSESSRTGLTNGSNNGMRDIMVHNKSGQGIPAEASISRLGSVKPRHAGQQWNSNGRMSDVPVADTHVHAGVGPSTPSGGGRRKSSPDIGGREERQSPCVILFRDITAKVATARELEAAKQSAERECATKTALLNFVSHELRNPLHAIKGILDLLEQTDTAPQIRQWHKALMSQSTVIETIVNDVLNFQSTALEISSKAFSIVQLIHEITEKQTLVAKCKGLVLETEVLAGDPNSTSSETIIASETDESNAHGRKVPTTPLQFSIHSSPTARHRDVVAGIQSFIGSDHTMSSELEVPKSDHAVLAIARVPDYVYGDRARVKEILLNLLINGMKFMTTGIVKLTVCCSKRSHNWCRIHLTVKDMGEGFSEKELEMVFQPFAHVTSSVGKLHGGTGLCLAIVHDLVKSMNGQIEVVSQIGEGTAITVDLPMEICHEIPVEFQQQLDYTPPRNRRPEDRTAECADSPCSRTRNISCGPSRVEGIPSPENSHKTQKRIRVLVVEDNLMIQKLQARQLAKVGYTVEMADNGAKALAMVTEGSHYDLILMDLNMPVMDGVTATTKIRQMGWQGIIVALTANVLKETERECLDKGFNYFLSKPLNLGVLTQHIEKTLLLEGKQ